MKLRNNPLLLRRTHSNSFIGSDSADSGSRPVKAKGKMPTRKMSTENILEDLGPKQTGPIRASSMEDISTYSTRSSGSTAAPRVVDAVVKLYQPDHTYKYIDISPVSSVRCDSYILLYDCFIYTLNLCTASSVRIMAYNVFLSFRLPPLQISSTEESRNSTPTSLLCHHQSECH